MKIPNRPRKETKKPMSKVTGQPISRRLVSTDNEDIFKLGDLIRKTESLILKQFERGLVSGTTHTCIGQELCQISVVRALDQSSDVVLSNHRNHGHFLTYSGQFLPLVAEVMGRATGVCGGHGGSQHIAFQNFHSNGVQGGMTGIGVGYALAQKLRKDSGMVAVIVGDGTLGEGLLYESMNLAAIWNLNILFVVENNGIAQTTETSETIGGDIMRRGEAFGLVSQRLADDQEDFIEQVDSYVSSRRNSGTPGFLVIDTKRMGPHSKGDDLRSEEEKDLIAKRDPLSALGSRISASTVKQIQSENDAFIQSVESDVSTSKPAHFDQTPVSVFGDPKPSEIADGYSVPDSLNNPNVRSHINHALAYLLEAEGKVVLLGEDLHDPYGGAFKVTAGLSTRFPERVISTPISEAGVTGCAVGLALAGHIPILEIMFADFLTLTLDQLLNHAVKFPGIFEDTEVPLVIRTPCGGRRGYGPTHSQSLENLCASIAGLTVLYPSHRHDSGKMLVDAALKWNYPVVFLEHKLLYSENQSPDQYEEVKPEAGLVDKADIFPTLIRRGGDSDLTILTYGGSLPVVEDVVSNLNDSEELSVDIVVPGLLSPLPRNTLLSVLKKVDVLVIVEETHSEFGVGAEIAATLVESGFTGRLLRIGAPPVPIPSARTLEAEVLPSAELIATKILKFIEAS